MEAGEEDRAAMKLIYATDLHGDRAAYEALAGLAEGERADALVLGGDLFAYSRCAAPQIAFADGPFLAFLRWLASARIPVLTIPGNVDVRAAVERVREFEREELIRILGPRPIHLPFGGDERGGVDLVGYPYVPPTPFRLKENERRDLATDRYQGPWPIFLSSPDPEQEWIEAPEDYLDRLPSIEEDLARIPTTERPWILVAHTPPWGGALDRSHLGGHGGSRAVRRWIEEWQPLLTLHGHIHESPDLSGHWAEYIGGTICINPGAAGEPTLQAVIFETERLPQSLAHTNHGRSEP
jgi:Icc-related predicted phosphoesterase